ncbi:hypothetical protein LCGC14_0969860 [marine sediment metagenome]|uniref:Uncharacterized protein n=1 Tax=marine sediment metagenome TaxID=412755 RepID=A0A0F9NY37_9ZZZZ
MDICKSCHEKDRNVTNCQRTLAMHIRYIGFISECSICGGKEQDIYECYAYDVHASSDK